MSSRLLVLSLAIALCSPARVASAAAEPATPGRPAATYTVTVSSDGHDSNTADGLCYDGVNGCTLRAAIEQAFSHGGTTTIDFHSSLNNSALALQNGLGPINWYGDNITVDGVGSNITMNAAPLSLPVGSGVFRIAGSGNRLYGLTIAGANGDGVQVGDLAGTGSGSNNIVQYNIIVGSAGSGVYVKGSNQGGGHDNWILNNNIGARSGATNCSDPDRNTYGVYVALNAVSTRIGNNLVVCSWQDGISIDGAGGAPLNTSITFNDIGGNSTDMGNGWAGVAVYSGASGITIDHDVIVGNDRQGVWLGNTSDITISNSTIGLNAAGTRIPNTLQGIHVDGTVGAVTDVSIINNVISGNGQQGVLVQSSAYIEMKTNIIGPGIDGIQPIGNGEEGVLIENSQHTDVVGGGTVAFNGGAGIAITGNGSTFDRAYPSHIYGNKGLAIDLGNDGFTPNGLHTPPGPNDWLAYPVITQTAGSVITGTTCALCGVYVYKAYGNPAAAGGGYTEYLGGTTADALGRWSYTLSGGATRWDITLQACSVTGCGDAGVSELSPRARAWLPVVRRQS
jgi:hypothetical protein